MKTTDKNNHRIVRCGGRGSGKSLLLVELAKQKTASGFPRVSFPEFAKKVAEEYVKRHEPLFQLIDEAKRQKLFSDKNE